MSSANDAARLRESAVTARLQTPRLVVRLAAEAEAAAVVDYFARNRAHLGPWEPRHPDEFYSQDYWHDRLALYKLEALEGRGWRAMVYERDRPERVIGTVSITNVVRGALQGANLGYGLDGELQGRGYMREALEAVVAFAFDTLGLHRLEANYRPENARSGLLLKRLGFVPQGFARDYLLIDGAWRDHVLTARVNAIWKPQE
ncbi:MAG: GNAT family N-acetyltransferase [Sandaracinaceae bacterium]|nr:GNAT family N-acetyltransferase [Sandaracinaceae bacterium]